MKHHFFVVNGGTRNIDQIQGSTSSFERVEHGITLALTASLAKDGYGTVSVNGIPVPVGKKITIDVLGQNIPGLMIGVGSVVQEYGKKYTLRFTGFRGEDGKPFADSKFTIKTEERGMPDGDPVHAEHDEVALQAARESMVLLKNDNHVLPLKPEETLNLFGRGQYIFYNTAVGAGLINPRWQPNIHQSIQEHSRFTLNEDIAQLYKRHETVIPTKAQMEAAREKSDTGIVIISRASGEFADNRPAKNWYYLTDAERELIKTVAETFPKTVAIINSGYPIELGWIRDYGIDAVLHTGFGGQAAGYALMEILDGRCNPSAKLPDTFAWDYYDYPSAHNFPNLTETEPQPGAIAFGTHIHYEEDIYVGYRYFDTFGKEAAFSFGHGLSYTDFEVHFTEPVWDGSTVQVKASAKNIGQLPGKEVVQLYIAAPDNKLEKPFRVLAGFEKTPLLNPGEEVTLTLTANKSDFSSYDEESHAFILEQGDYRVFCGNSLANARDIGGFAVTETEVVRQCEGVNPPMEPLHRISKQDPVVQGNTKTVPFDQRIAVPAPRLEWHPQPLPQYAGKRIVWDDLKKDPSRLSDFVAQMSVKELSTLMICGGANWYFSWHDGTAGRIRPLSKYKIPQFTVTDGNSGVNMKKKNIGFPSSTSIAATFNKEIAYAVGRVIAEESRENNVQLNLGPAMNIHRNVLNGRHPEYFSEDPYLSGTMAGFHSKGLEDNGLGSCFKHMFCNGSDTARKASHSILSERALREIYIKTFEIAMAIQEPSAFMTSYNAVNGIYPAESVDILQNLFRKEWNFDGLIMTDWNTYDSVDTLEMVKAGNEWITEGESKHIKLLQEAVRDGKLSRAVLEQACIHIVKTLLKVCK